MAKKKTIKRARKGKRAEKSLTSQAGEFIREEIALGLSKARDAGLPVPVAIQAGRKPASGTQSSRARKKGVLRGELRAAGTRRRRKTARRAVAAKAIRSKVPVARRRAVRKASRARTQRRRTA
jgi:hypothetical protein